MNADRNETVSKMSLCGVFNGSDEGMTTFEQLFYIGSGVTGFVFNTVVMLIAVLHIDTNDKPRQIIVINMTVADLLTCLVYMLTRPFLEHLPVLFCYPYYVTICTVQLCSCFNLLWLNVDKFIFVQFPLQYYIIVNRFRILIVSILTWTAIISLVMFAYHFMSYRSNPVSVLPRKSIMNFIILSSLINHHNEFQPRCDLVALPPFIYTPICVMYISLIIGCFTISVIIFLIAQGSNRIENKARSKLFQRLFFLFCSTLWTFFTCLPYRLLYLTTIIESHLTIHYCPSHAMMTTTDFFFRVLVLGTVINPVITIVTQRVYRERLLWYMKRIRFTVCHSNDDPDATNRLHKFTSSMLKDERLCELHPEYGQKEKAADESRNGKQLL
ncbi:unnamed protein product [Anisakis simplex]|uniref:AEX-2 (inferred by orthology to a C. elegans protein) n=1 Tax=Anisakis simplex TaxID=6269 RepID=A0A0M3JTQ6_ANISI|nr:unnamed protein product [Anisakis simplex]